MLLNGSININETVLPISVLIYETIFIFLNARFIPLR